MSFEVGPGSPEGVLFADGTINETFVAEHYGLGIEEASQEIQFGTHKGTVAQMLADEACPVGGQIQNAYETDGIEGVARVFEGVKMMDPNFSVEISEATLERERTKAIETPGPAINEETESAAKEPKETEKPDDPDDPAVSGSGEAQQTNISEESAAAMDEAIIRQREEATELDKDVEEETFTYEPEKLDDHATNEHTTTEEAGQIRARTAPISTVKEQNQRQDVQSTPATKQALTDKPFLETISIAEIRTVQQEDPAAAIQPEILSGEQALPAPNAVAENKPEPREPTEFTVIAEEDTRLPEDVLIAEYETPNLLTSTLESESDEAELVSSPNQAVAELRNSLQLIPIEEISEDEIVPAEISGMITPAVTELVRQVSEVLMQPETIEKESVLAAIEKINFGLEDAKSLEETGEDIDEAIGQLTVACMELFDELGLEYEEATVEHFVSLVLAARKIEATEEKLPDESMQDKGTHEFKPGIVDARSLAFSAKRKFSSLQTLGKWAIATSSA